jgi:mucolipin 2
MFAWLMMINYLGYNKNVNLMTTTLNRSKSNIGMFLLGVVPFFLGFVFLA